MIEVAPAPGMDRGVFARSAIDEGAVISETATWLLTPADLVLFDQMSISGHWFEHPTMRGHGLLALGTVSLVNHAWDSNATLTWELRELGWVAVLRAARPVVAGEQIFLDYTSLDSRS